MTVVNTHSPVRLMPPASMPIIHHMREVSPVRHSLIIDRSRSPIREPFMANASLMHGSTRVIETITRSPVRSRSPFRERTSYVNTTCKLVQRALPVDASHNRNIATHMELMNAR